MTRVPLEVCRDEHDKRQRVADDANQDDERHEVQLEVDEHMTEEYDIDVVSESRQRVHLVADFTVVVRSVLIKTQRISCRQVESRCCHDGRLSGRCSSVFVGRVARTSGQ